MQTFKALELTDLQKQVLTAYANTCYVKLAFAGASAQALDFLKETGLVDKYQDHISDLGAAYLFTQCAFPFDRFVKIHKWEKRLASRIAVGKAIADSKDAENFYHKCRYQLLIKYNCFDYGMPSPPAQKNAEGTPSNMAQLMTELFAMLIESDLFKWQKLKAFLVSQDPYNDQDLRKINSKESFAEYVQTAARRLGAGQ